MNFTFCIKGKSSNAGINSLNNLYEGIPLLIKCQFR